MKTRTLFSLGLSALAIGTVMAGSAIGGDAAKGSPADHARKAGKALEASEPTPSSLVRSDSCESGAVEPFGSTITALVPEGMNTRALRVPRASLWTLP